MIEIVGLSIIATLFVALIVTLSFLISTKKQNKKISAELANRESIANESYGKFIYDSREWAFKYIEEVQSVLKSFKDKVDPQLDYFNKYGKIVSSPHITMLNEISEAYDELKTLLPEENKEK